MDTTTHTTNSVDFVDWRAKAKEKLEQENKEFKGSREAAVVREYVLRTLSNFCDEEPRFAEVVCNTKRTFSECCAAIVDKAGNALSDLEAYRKAVQFYFPNAEVAFVMNIKLTGEAPSEEEMNRPAEVKPKETVTQTAQETNPKPKYHPKAKKKEPLNTEDDCIQISLWG